MFNANKLLGTHSGVAPGSDTEKAALAAVREQRNAEAIARGRDVPAHHLGIIAGGAALEVSPSDIARVEARSMDTQSPPNGEELSVLPPVEGPEAS